MFHVVAHRYSLDMGELGDRLRAAVTPALDAGEELRGVLIATQSSAFKTRAVALATTERRLIVQGLTRRLEPDGEAMSIPPERVADASVDGAGGGWMTVASVIADGSAVTLRMRTTDGEKLKLMMMRGSGMFGKLGGGEDQRLGVEAFAAWMAATGR
jgi:hypothetical protein